jgi:RNA recognition motif-containing protein
MGNHDDGNDDALPKWKNTIINILEGENLTKKSSTKGDSNDGNDTQQQLLQRLKVKKLRKLVLLSLQLDEDDKAAKKSFKHSIQTLEMDGTIHLDEEGHITLKKKKKRKQQKEDEMKKTKRPRNSTTNDHVNENTESDLNNDGDQAETQNISTKNVPCVGNPQGITRLFVGNLSFTINEALLEEFLLPGKMTHLKWITDKETGKFYGSAFVEMYNSMDAATAVSKAGQSLLGRPIKINYAPALPGDKWPPEKKVITGGETNTTTKSPGTTKATAGGVGIKAMSVKPENCCKLFIGNLSYDIDDAAITKFFASVDAEVKAVRWIHHKDSGDFKGVYVVVIVVVVVIVFVR